MENLQGLRILIIEIFQRLFFQNKKPWEKKNVFKGWGRPSIDQNMVNPIFWKDKSELPGLCLTSSEGPTEHPARRGQASSHNLCPSTLTSMTLDTAHSLLSWLRARHSRGIWSMCLGSLLSLWDWVFPTFVLLVAQKASCAYSGNDSGHTEGSLKLTSHCLEDL